MIIPSKLIKLDYDPTKDILFVEWPDFDYHTLPEIQQILDKITETIRHYDIKYLMIDSRTATITLGEADYDQIASGFVQDLSSTRIRKVARLVTDNLQRENQVRFIQGKINMAMKIESFESVDEALHWFKF